MEFYSLAFVLFLAVFWLLSRLVPAKTRWCVLLAASLLFYLCLGGTNLLFLLTTAATVWGAGLAMEAAGRACKARLNALQEGAAEKQALRAARKAARQTLQRRKRLALLAGLLINFGILGYLKYWNVLWGAGGLLLPLGISFYTFQSISYLIDVYNEKYAAEKNFLHFLLFVSWFPQLLEGPIGRYDRLRPQFFEQNGRITADRAGRAALRILFGLMKKYAVADLLSGGIASIFDGGVSGVEGLPGSVIIFGILLYSAQQYCDFSGGIDIVMGVSSLFGVELTPNFRQPYFAVSLGDFWRRWHISLGAWMRDYVFYPLALLKPMQRFGKWAARRFGRHAGRTLPACAANLVVFFIVGVWHGAELHYVLWGLYNGLVIALSDLLAPTFARAAQALRLRTDTKAFHLFRILRTFIIVNIGWYFDRIVGLPETLICLRNSFTRFEADRFAWGIGNTIFAQTGTTRAYTLGGMAIAGAALLVVLADSVLRERGRDVYALLQSRAPVLRWAVCYAMLFLLLGSFMLVGNAGGFLYANF